jgi:hypothetical protein
MSAPLPFAEVSLRVATHEAAGRSVAKIIRRATRPAAVAPGEDDRGRFGLQSLRPVPLSGLVRSHAWCRSSYLRSENAVVNTPGLFRFNGYGPIARIRRQSKRRRNFAVSRFGGARLLTSRLARTPAPPKKTIRTRPAFWFFLWDGKGRSAARSVWTAPDLSALWPRACQRRSSARSPDASRAAISP